MTPNTYTVFNGSQTSTERHSKPLFLSRSYNPQMGKQNCKSLTPKKKRNWKGKIKSNIFYDGLLENQINEIHFCISQVSLQKDSSLQTSTEIACNNLNTKQIQVGPHYASKLGIRSLPNHLKFHWILIKIRWKILVNIQKHIIKGKLRPGINNEDWMWGLVEENVVHVGVGNGCHHW